MPTPYSKKVVPLDVKLDRQAVIKGGTQIPDVTVLRLPAAAADAVYLHVGEGGDPIELIQGMAIHITPPESTGLYVSSDAPFAGLSLKLLIGYVAGGTAQAPPA
jgi:hypothetical protein